MVDYCVSFEMEVKNETRPSLGWIVYPDGVRLPAIPYMDVDGCLCGAAYEEFHYSGCSDEICPRCGGCLDTCYCFTIRRVQEMSVQESINEIERIAEKLSPDAVRIGVLLSGVHPVVIRSYLSVLRDIVSLFGASRRVLDLYPSRALAELSTSEDASPALRNAVDTAKRASVLWAEFMNSVTEGKK